jgi:hypothetical protein
MVYSQSLPFRTNLQRDRRLVFGWASTVIPTDKCCKLAPRPPFLAPMWWHHYRNNRSGWRQFDICEHYGAHICPGEMAREQLEPFSCARSRSIQCLYFAESAILLFWFRYRRPVFTDVGMYLNRGVGPFSVHRLLWPSLFHSPPFMLPPRK